MSAVKNALGIELNDLKSKRRRFAELDERISAALAGKAEAEMALRDLAAGGANDAALDEAEVQVASAERRIATLQAGREKLRFEIEHDEAEAAQREAEAERAAAADEIAGVGESLKPVADSLLTNLKQAQALAATLDVFEVKQVAGFLATLAPELERTFAGSLQLIRSTADHVRSGHLPAMRPRDPEPAPPPPQVEESAMIFTLEDITWADPAGGRRRAGRYQRAVIPRKLVEAALAAALIDRIDCERAARFGEKGAVHEPSADHLCKDLDALLAPPTGASA